MLKLIPDQEVRVCDVLVNLGWLETEQALHVEGVRAIRELFQCPLEEARTILGDVRARKLVGVEITPGGQLDPRKPMPLAEWRWIRPATGS
jgi:hypothetical protein